MTTELSARAELSPQLLSNDLLSSLTGELRAPSFDRRALTPAVVHIGVGGFHRAHQAVYLDDLAGLGNHSWGETGVGLRSPVMKAALQPQDCLFTVVEHDDTTASARVVASMTKYLYGPSSPRAVLDALADERTRVVTLTITGDGYNLDEAGVFRGDDPAVRAEVTDGPPSSVQGYLVAALDLRRRAGLPPFTVLSCDNVPDNGRAARAAVVGFARLRDAALADWIDSAVSFPSSMVDRITPVSDGRSRRLVAEQFGVYDRSPVLTERFRQWVVEDDFVNGRPPLEDVGAQLVTNVAPYALIKKRLLNGSHSALGYLGELAGCGTTDDAMANPLFVAYLAALMRDEIAPLLPAVPGMDLPTYQTQVLQRFTNTKISDDLNRLSRRGSTKMPAYLLPSLVEARRLGRPTSLLTLAVAAWLRFLRGYGFDGLPIDVVDEHRDVLQARARSGGTDPRPLLALRSIFGELGDDPVVVRELESALISLDRHGVSATLRRYLATASSPAAGEIGTLETGDSGAPTRWRRTRRAAATPRIEVDQAAAMSA